jgi:hypothetical protein
MGVIKVTAQKNPAFLYDGDSPGESFDPDDVAHGFLRGFFLEHVSASCCACFIDVHSHGPGPEAHLHFTIVSSVKLKVPQHVYQQRKNS